ncbi:MAG: LPS export ABC transporter periplasmic protein LptC [Gemmatimonadota bacterium]|nr:LPS export ABC transporter periplasmic protein LptC [Gemmatimonadota bacterium]MDE3173477.1 LPS export ABC transporter periplasmic protein LptC [Gemmatimonadota bacterium]
MTRRPALLALAAAVAAIAAAGCDRAAEPPTTRVPSLVDSAEQVLFNVTTILTNAGVERGTMTADTAFVFHDQTQFDFRDVHVAFRDSVGRPTGTMQSDSGRYDMRTEVLEGWGHVVITTNDGKKLETPQLRYNQATNVITSDTSFVLTQADKVQRGIGLVTDPSLNTIRILRGAGGSGVITSFPNR